MFPRGIRLLLLVCALDAFATASASGQTAFRAFWADAFHPGFKSTSEIDTMIARAHTGNYNAIIAEVMAYQDSGTGAHGAYWNSSIIPKATDFSPSSLDPLTYLCQQAHAQNPPIEVHAWLVTYRVCTAWPPANNSLIQSKWIMVPQGNMGGGPATISGKYVLDPGSPDVQEYLVSIVRELVTNYPIDGINWDYIRYEQTDAGYPSDATYQKSSLARFQQITGYAGTPPASGNTSWNDFRRRTINELVRRCRAEIPNITSNPRQPLRQTADLICFGSAPANFTSSDAYLLHQNWQLWMQNGWLDAGIPMNYKDERTSATSYRGWVSAAISWRYNRHMYCGQGNYLNSKANSVTQLQYVYSQGANGSTNYSYYSTADENDDGIEEADFTWYTYVASNIFTSPAALPTMPWRSSATATEGTLWGRVTALSNGAPIDDATVQVGALAAVQTDGNGYYTVTLIPAVAGGTNYSVTASKSGYPPSTVNPVQVIAGGLRRQDFVLGAPAAPIIAEVSPDPYPVVSGAPYMVQLTLTQGTADTWTLLTGPPGAAVSSSGFVSGWTPGAGDVGQLKTFNVHATNASGSDDETWQVSVSASPPCTDTLITGFEGYANGTLVLFRNPRYSGSTSGDLAASPDIAQVTDEVTPFAGSKCYKLSWQFVDIATSRWMRATTSNATNVPNPTIELNKPIRVRLRIDSGSLRVCLGIRETGTTAAVGANGGTTGTIEWVGASGKISTAPQGKLLPARLGVWQTLIFDPLRDPILPQTGDGVLSAPNNKGTFEQLAFASMGSAGPFTVYIDNVEQLCAFPPTPAADFDVDGDVDALDYATFQACALGPEISQTDPACLAARLDADDDVDGNDFGIWQRCFSSTNIPADANCAN